MLVISVRAQGDSLAVKKVETSVVEVQLIKLGSPEAAYEVSASSSISFHIKFTSLAIHICSVYFLFIKQMLRTVERISSEGRLLDKRTFGPYFVDKITVVCIVSVMVAFTILSI